MKQKTEQQVIIETQKTMIDLLKISDEIFDIVENREEMTTGDYQSAIEAQVRIAYQYGLKKNQKYIENLEYGRSEEQLDYIKMLTQEEE